jgi:2-C-methyl-D-erythritol 4-phosphate cytidylyltransferase
LEAITLADATAQWVGIHDAARPMIDTAWLEAAFIDLKQLLGTKGVVGLCAGTKVQDTVKACVHPSASNGMMMPVITHTVDRTPLWQVQTPQLFSFSALRYAHQTVDTNISATDDAQLIELAHAGGVVIKQAASSNVKLTTWDDYQFLRHLTG